MTEPLRIGYIPLCDAAPLILAHEDGLFEDEGVTVVLSKEHSWARIRDKLAFGELDAAHMLSPMVVASALGIAPTPEPFATAFSFGLNGNGITASAAFWEEMNAAQPGFDAARPIGSDALRMACRQRMATGRPPPTLSMVYPYSMHNYLLRYWLACSGLDPDRDVRLIVVPPPEMVPLMKEGQIDLFCVGEPYNTLAESDGAGKRLVAGAEVWSAAPEKVLGVRQTWARANEDIHERVIRALLNCVDRLRTEEGQARAVDLLAEDRYLGIAAEHLRQAFVQPSTGEETLRMGSIYDPGDASEPSVSRALWIASQMIRWGQVGDAAGLEPRIEAAFLNPLFAKVARSLSFADMRGPTPGRFIDGRQFAPGDLRTYLEGFVRHRLKAGLDTIFPA